MPLSLRAYTEKVAGFPIEETIASMMEETGIRYPVDVYFDATEARASAVRPLGQAEIHLPTRAVIKRKMPELSEDAITAKMQSQVAEELCHLGAHETCHNKKVTSCTIGLMKKHLTKKQLADSYIKDKIIFFFYVVKL